MKNNTIKDQKQFVKDAKICILSFGAKEIENNRFELETNLGKLNIKLDDDNTYTYSVFMQFEDLDVVKFYKYFSESEPLNKHSFKYNFHDYDAESVLIEIEERLNNLTRIK